jgi:response regulator of citrate/malate metabolism
MDEHRRGTSLGVTKPRGDINSDRTERKTIMADKTFEENVSAQLEKSKSQMTEIETLAKGKASQTALDAIAGLKNKKQEIEKKVQGLKTSTDTKAKAAIETDLAKFNEALGQVATSLKSQTPAPGQQK